LYHVPEGTGVGSLDILTKDRLQRGVNRIHAAAKDAARVARLASAALVFGDLELFRIHLGAVRRLVEEAARALEEVETVLKRAEGGERG